MSLPNSPSIATFSGNGIAVDFPFTFKVWSPDELQVLVIKPDAASMPVAFTASLGENGGSVRVLIDGKPLPTGWKLSIIRNMPFEQQVDLVSGTRFDPQVIEDALDKATAERQQLREAMGRAIVVPPGNAEPPELLAQQIFDARDQALTSAANAAASEVNAEEAAAEAVLARESIQQTIDTAGSAALGDIFSAKSEAVTTITELTDVRTSQFTTLADSTNLEMTTLAAEHIRNINTTGDTKLTELNTLSGNMSTIANQAMANVVAEGDRQEARQQLAASSGVTAILLKGDEQENRLSLKGSEIILEATTQASRAETEADRAEDAANRAVDMTGLGLASKTNFGMARAGSGIDVDEAGVFSVKFPRVVSTPACTFVADVGIGYSYTLSMSASTGAAEGFITQFRVFVDNQPEQIVQATGNAASLDITVQGLDLQVGTIVVSAEDNYQNPSNDQVLTYIKHAVSIQAPRILQPVEGSVDVALSLALTLQALQVTGLPATPEATQILVSKTDDFAEIFYDSGEIGYTVSHTVPEMLPDNTELYLKVRHKAQFYGWSAYGPVTSVTTIAKALVRPSVISPPNTSADQSLNPTIVASAMASTGIVDVPVNTQVQVSAGLDFSALVFDTGENAVYAPSVNVPVLLIPLTAYYVRVRHKGNTLGWSPWSLASSFTTLNAFVDKAGLTLLSAMTDGIVQTPCPSLHIAAFANVGPVDTPSNTQVQIATNAIFTTPLFDTGTSHAYANSISSNLDTSVTGGVKYTSYLALGSTYFVRVRHRGTLFGWGNWSDAVSFTTLARYVAVPTITAPAEGSTTTTLRPALVISAYSSRIPTDTPLNTHVQISTTADFSTTLVDTGDTGAYLTSFSPSANLPLNTKVYVRVRHKGTVWGFGAWSETRIFTTLNAYVRPPVFSLPATGTAPPDCAFTLDPPVFVGQTVGPMTIRLATTIAGLAVQQSTEASISGGGRVTVPNIQWGLTYYAMVWVDGSITGRATSYIPAGGGTAASPASFSTRAPYVHTPAINAPAEGATATLLRPVFTFSAFSNAGPVDQAVNTQVQVSNASTFATTILDSGQAAAYATSYTPTADLPLGVLVYARARHKGKAYGWSAWSDTRKFTTINAFVKVPAMSSPVNNATNVAINPLLSLAAPEAVGQTVAKMEVQASTVTTFASIAWTSGQIAPATSIKAQLAGLNTKYYVRARYQGSVTGWTAWGAVVGFTIMAATQWDFTASGSFTAPVAGKYQLECVGGGGGGSVSSTGNADRASAGGGGGGYAKSSISLTANATFSITVGGGGPHAPSTCWPGGCPRDNIAGNGGTSSIDSYISATGGIGGISKANTAETNATGGAGGTGSGGTTNSTGGTGNSIQHCYGANCNRHHPIYGGSGAGGLGYGNGGSVYDFNNQSSGAAGFCRITYIGD